MESSVFLWHLLPGSIKVPTSEQGLDWDWSQTGCLSEAGFTQHSLEQTPVQHKQLKQILAVF